jgi:hypothetical protein
MQPKPDFFGYEIAAAFQDGHECRAALASCMPE